jgi:hypothetical protein
MISECHPGGSLAGSGPNDNYWVRLMSDRRDRGAEFPAAADKSQPAAKRTCRHHGETQTVRRKLDSAHLARHSAERRANKEEKVEPFSHGAKARALHWRCQRQRSCRLSLTNCRDKLDTHTNLSGSPTFWFTCCIALMERPDRTAWVFRPSGASGETERARREAPDATVDFEHFRGWLAEASAMAAAAKAVGCPSIRSRCSKR